MQPSFQPALPPHIEFDSRSVEKRKTVEEGGAIYYEMQDVIIVTPSGSKDRIERVWAEYEPYLVRMVKDGHFPRAWLDEYRGSYKEWKETGAVSIKGTPIKNWPVATNGEVLALAQAKIYSVEELAEANESALQRVGMGARSLKQRAQDWVVAQKGTAPLVAQLDAMRQTLARLEEANRSQADQIRQLQQIRQPAGQPTNVPDPQTVNLFITPPSAERLDRDLDDGIGDALNQTARELANAAADTKE